jgi:hypothetical protein
MPRGEFITPIMTRETGPSGSLHAGTGWLSTEDYYRIDGTAERDDRHAHRMNETVAEHEIGKLQAIFTLPFEMKEGDL